MMNVETDIQLLIRIGDLARLTGVTIPYLRRLADEGLVHTCRVGSGRHRRFPRDETIRRVRELLNIKA